MPFSRWNGYRQRPCLPNVPAFRCEHQSEVEGQPAAMVSCNASLGGARSAVETQSARLPVAHRQSACYTLNRMVQHPQTRLDTSFAALSDATRRGVLEQLGRSNASITDLATKFHMTLTGMKK